MYTQYKPDVEYKLRNKINDMKSRKIKSRFTSPENLFLWMRNNMTYSDFTTLKSADDVFKIKSGSCHDQVILEYSELSKMGLNPKAEFLIEYKPGSTIGGMTHSFVYYKKGNKIYWFEHAMGGQEGIHEFNSINDIKAEITRLHIIGKIGNYKAFPKLKWCSFIPEDHIPGETIGELVDITLSNSKRMK